MDNLENIAGIITFAAGAAVGAYIMLDLSGIKNSIRLYIDRKILGKDSQIITTGLPYSVQEEYVPGSRTRRLNNSPTEVH